jgi:hypothetical protein
MADVRTGKSDVRLDKFGHTSGIKQGNSIGNYEKNDGLLPDGRRTAASSTGVNAAAREPIDPSMPNLPPG